MIKTFDTLYIHPELKDHARAKELMRTIPHRRLKELDQIEKLAARQKDHPVKAVRRGKFNVAISPYPGRMVEPCPATRGMRCCRYRVINLVSGCPIDCSYCILQGYLNRPTIFIYPELEKIFAEVDAELEADWEYPLRYGTGELSDSLALDHMTGFSRDLVKFFGSRQKNWFEFKTKSANVDTLCELKPAPGNILVSWSVNPQVVIDTEELGAAPLEARFEAAARVQDAGSHPGKIAWISLGCLRFSPWMAPYFAERFKDHPLLAGEFFPVPPDGKYRYPQPVRIEVYRKINEWIKSFDSRVYVYLCMESATVYRWALGREVGHDWLAVEKGFPAPPGGGKVED